MPNSNGDECEKTPPCQGENRKTAQNKRKRNRNRKKATTKVENLVSKTFQAKLVANLTQSENQVLLKTDTGPLDQTKVHQNPEKDLQSSYQVEVLSKDTFSSKGSSTPFVPMADLSPKHNLANSVSLTMVQTLVSEITQSEKSREEILAEREAKKLAKQQAKKKNKASNAKINTETLGVTTLANTIDSVNKTESKHLPNGHESINKSQEGYDKREVDTMQITEKFEKVTVSDSSIDNAATTKDVGATYFAIQKKTKAERRAIQEAQRTAKANASLNKVNTTKAIKVTANEQKIAISPKETVTGRVEKLPLTKFTKDCKVKLFNHLESCRKDSNLFVNNPHIHPIIVRLGQQYAKRTIVGSNARCISFLSALKTVIQDYETPAKKEFARSLETTIKNSVDHLHKCRPLAVSVCNAYKHIKHVLTQLPMEQPESELKEYLCHFVDTYIENQIGKAAEAISISVQEKISNGDVILTFGCSSLINYIFEEAHRRNVDFRVIVVDSRPFSEGQELLRRLTAKEIPCTYVLINAVGFVMPEVSKIFLGAHALLSNGYVMARTGTAQVALVARSFNVPVLVCCETHKFSERFQTDAIVYNELGNPDDLIISEKCRLMNWQSQNKLSPLNLNYDITPPELVTAVVTEVAILPCTSVPVILRIKPTEIGY